MKNDFFRITLDTNPEDCNLKCIMCEEHSPFSNFIPDLEKKTGIRKRRMSIELIEKVFREVKDLGIKEIIPSTMGEPLLFKEFEKIIKLCNSNQIKLNLTTNGTFPKKPIEEWAEILIPICSDIKISFNGFGEIGEKIMLGTNSEKIISNIKKFSKLRNESNYNEKTSLTLQMTFLKTNIDFIKDILYFCYENKINRLKGHQLWAHFKEIENFDLRKNPELTKRWNDLVMEIRELNEFYSKKFNFNVKLENFYKIESASEVDDSKNCPFLGKELWISATGKISPCCAPDNLRESLGDFGNLNNINLSNLIHSKEYIHLQKHYKEFELCKTCLMRK